jgi:preprotein translocase subunit SecY
MFKESFEKVFVAFKSKEVRDRIFFSTVILIVFRALAAVPLPGVDAGALAELFSGNAIGDNLALLSGGLLQTASVIAIGIGPYISASIIIQLLGSVIPKFEELRNEGAEGRRKLSTYTRYLTVPLAVMQSFVVYSSLRGFNLIEPLVGADLAVLIATLTAGAMIVMWMGELVTESGVGNGSSYIILLGILAGIPEVFTKNLRTSDTLQMVWFLIILALTMIAIVIVTQAERRIKVMYSRRVRVSGNQDSYIPIKIAQFGVMPVIFAVSLISFPALMAQFLIGRDVSDRVTEISLQVIDFLNTPLVQNWGLFLLVVGFSFFYVTVVFNPKELSENLQKNGGFIPGIRPGTQTSNYLRKVSFRLTAVGGVFLGILAILPTLLVTLDLLPAQFFSGTSLLIAVGVVLDMKRQIESMVVVRNYDKYL